MIKHTLAFLLAGLILVSCAQAHGHHGSEAHAHENSFYSNFSALFPYDSPRINAFLATFYISAIPNILLLFVPANIKGSSLNVLVSFAVGGLLGDVFLHLIPHTFQEGLEESLKLGGDHLVKRNICLGVAIFAGVSLFYVIDKVMRILSGNAKHSHAHGHTHEPTPEISTAAPAKDSGLKQRKKGARPEKLVAPEPVAPKEVKHSAYLNLVADFSHNFTDGLAIAASFYISKSIGITTTLAVFFHEIPHEIGDFAILLQAGFSRASAMYSQFFTAIGAFLGTAAGVAIQEALSHSTGKASDPSKLSGLLSHLPIAPSDLVLPITAGGFLYIATSSVIPELLETPADFLDGKEGTPCPNKLLFQLAKEMTAMFLGVGLMALVSLAE